jgi:hypothetical protein
MLGYARSLQAMARKKDDAHPIRVSATAYEHAQALLTYVAKHGWRGLGIDREDPPTITAVLEAALESIAQRMKKGDR